MEWYVGVLRKYAEFNGRARRKEYWTFVLINMGISLALGAVDGVISAVVDTDVTVFGGLYGLLVLVPSVAVTVRRLHDTDRSGWWYFIVLIPIIGAVLLIVWLATDGDSGANRFGPDPKAYAPQPYAAAPTAPLAAGAPSAVPAGWAADPSGRHEFRYWDGTAWTEHVSDSGVTSTDAL